MRECPIDCKSRRGTWGSGGGDGGGGKERMATTSHEVMEGWKKHTSYLIWKLVGGGEVLRALTKKIDPG